MVEAAEGKRGYHHGDLARVLVEVATEMVRADGAPAFSLRSAARAAGVEPAAVYRHFADRGTLLGRVASEGFALMGQRMLDGLAAAAPDPDERFLAVGRAYVSFGRDEPELFALMFGVEGRSARETSASPSPYGLLSDCIASLEAAGGLVLPADEARTLAWSAVHGLTDLLIQGALPAASADESAALVTRGVLAALRSRDG